MEDTSGTANRILVGSVQTQPSQRVKVRDRKGITPMPRVQDTDEVRILRYFEEGALEKAELLFHIIAEKMRKRMPPGRSSPKKKDMRPLRNKRRTKWLLLHRSLATKKF